MKWLDSMPTRARLFKSLRSLRLLNPDVDSPAMTDAWQSRPRLGQIVLPFRNARGASLISLGESSCR